jgi:hypothetical protein
MKKGYKILILVIVLIIFAVAAYLLTRNSSGEAAGGSAGTGDYAGPRTPEGLKCDEAIRKLLALNPTGVVTGKCPQ